MRQIDDDLQRENLDVEVALVAPDFPLYDLADDGLFYHEMAWSLDPFPDALRVSRGRFPRESGEVAVVGTGFARQVRVGDQLRVLGEEDALLVVGLVKDVLAKRQGVLAAPGTWQTLQPSEDLALSQLGASPTFYFTGPDYASDIESAVHFLALRGSEHSGDFDESEILASARQSLDTRARARMREEALWTSRSPLSFWAPSLLLTPLVIVLGFYGVMRRLGPAVRMMLRAGVARATAVGGAWLALVLWVVVSLLVGAVLGMTLGHLAAQLVAGSWGSPSPKWRNPTAGAAATGSGLVVGAFLGWLLLMSRVRKPRQLRQTGGRRSWWSPTLTRHARHGVATLIACGVIVQLGRLDEPADGMSLTWLIAAGAALLTPDLLRAVVGRLPERALADRLTKRMLGAYPVRVAVTGSVVALSVALTSGFLTAFSSAMEADSLTRPATALVGQVALDGDDTPVFPVPESVISAAESVNSLAAQTPVEMRPIGRIVRAPDGMISDFTDTLGTQDLPGNTFAFDSVEDLARVLGGPLTGEQERVLRTGGVLIIDERVRIRGGQVEFFNNSTQESLGEFPALRAEITRTPWFDAVPGVMLVETAQDHALPLASGALIYTGVSRTDAQAVLDALAKSGINPENAEIHRTLPSLIPDAALLGSAVGLSMLVLFLAWSGTRAQVLSMRQWASRLTQLGVKTRWARKVIWKQYLWMLSVALPLGIVAGTLPLLVTRIFVPRMTVVVPWGQISILLLSLLGAVLLACTLATRTLTSTDAIGWRDEGE